MKKYTVQATYIASVELEVEVEDDGDPKDPADWKNIQSEHQTDYSLDDVEGAQEGWK